MKERLILNDHDIDRILTRMVHEIMEKPAFDLSKTALIGIRTRGAFLAERFKQKLEHFLPGQEVLMGALDISFHRDDLSHLKKLPRVGVTDIPFDLNEKSILLIDDVLYTGRTIRAALNELMDFGRPDSIKLAVLIDRGHREIPIKADIIGKNVPTHETDKIHVHLNECDNQDEVLLLCPN